MPLTEVLFCSLWEAAWARDRLWHCCFPVRLVTASMLVINTVLGLKKTAAFVGLVVIMSTLTGYLFGVWFG